MGCSADADVLICRRFTSVATSVRSRALDKRNITTYIPEWFNHELLAVLLAVGGVIRSKKCLTQFGIEDFS